jgi:hypothetical protein
MRMPINSGNGVYQHNPRLNPKHLSMDFSVNVVIYIVIK